MVDSSHRINGTKKEELENNERDINRNITREYRSGILHPNLYAPFGRLQPTGPGRGRGPKIIINRLGIAPSTIPPEYRFIGFSHKVT